MPNRNITYCQAINEALAQAMESDESVFLIGQGLKSPWYVGNTTKGFLKRFGEKRVIDTPVSENAITGAAVGAAITGMRPVVVHPRMDFMLYAFDPIINEAANWHYMSGGACSVPMVIWGIINRGGEQATQHSQALHAFFCHTPGLKVVMPSTPYDAKGLLSSAIKDNNPVIFIDDRWLYNRTGNVPMKAYTVAIGKGARRKKGRDVTVVSISYMMVEAEKACAQLAHDGIDAELIDLRSAKPWDQELVFDSVRKTGRLIVVDGGWNACGFAADVSARVNEVCLEALKAPVARVTLPDLPAPASAALEKAYYPGCEKIILAVKAAMGTRRHRCSKK